MKLKLPDWLPGDVKTAMQYGLFEGNRVAIRLCTYPEMRKTWEYISKQYSEKNGGEIARFYGIPSPEDIQFLPGSPLHFLTLLLGPKTKLDKVGRMPFGKRSRYLVEVRKTALRLKELLDGTDLVARSTGSLAEEERLSFDPNKVNADYLWAHEFAQLTAAEQTIAYQVRPNGSMLRRDYNYPSSILLETLDGIAAWAEHIGEYSDIFQNLQVVGQGGKKAEKASYLAVLNYFLKLADLQLNNGHLASILTAVFDDADGFSQNAVGNLKKRISGISREETKTRGRRKRGKE